MFIRVISRDLMVMTEAEEQDKAIHYPAASNVYSTSCNTHQNSRSGEFFFIYIFSKQ